MLQKKNYDFIGRLHEVHKHGLRNAELRPEAEETLIDETWKIAVAVGENSTQELAAEDFQDYLKVGMGLSLPIVNAEVPGEKQIFFRIVPTDSAKKDSFRIDVGTGVEITANSGRALRHAGVYLEDKLSLREGPFLRRGTLKREAMTRLRSVHSGSGMDDFPDAQLNAILHAGFNAIDLFVKKIDTTTQGHCDINDIISRAAKYGLGVVLYNYIPCFKHPDDPDAEAFFDSVYGNIFRKYPDAIAISLVGESLEFPSKDPASTGKRYTESIVDGIPETRPSPGWYPCSDYPAFLARIRDAVHAVKPEAEVIFSTYNWGWAPLEMRKNFLEHFPKGITLQITYEIFKQNKIGDLNCPVMDYTVSAVEPGFYFTSEAETAHRLGIPLRVTSNLAGTTWDFGTAPYVPVPQRWLKRMLLMREYLKQYGIDSFYENHHYGWWQNPAVELGKEVFLTPEADTSALENLLDALAVRDYGERAASGVVAAWNAWSSAMENYVASNEDQYGPWRTGPSYPFIFQPNISRTMANREIQFPTLPGAHFGYHIIKTLYQPYENENQSPGPMRYPKEIEKLEKMLLQWQQGLASVEKVLELMPAGRKRENGERLFALGKFIRNSIRTTLHMKHWWLLNIQLQAQSERKPMLELLDRIEWLAKEEIENVKDTIPCVEADSRLGWEPSMEYVCDKWHLEWKLRQMESTLRETATYRKIIQLN